MLEAKGTRLAQPNINTGDRAAPFADFTNRRVKHTQALRLRDGEWAFCYKARDENLTNQIIDSLKKGAQSLGMTFEGEPIWIEIPDDRDLQNDGCKDTRNGKNYIWCLENSEEEMFKHKVQVCFVLIGNDKDHPKIKNRLDKMNIVSQFMLYKNIQKKVGVMGVITNLLRQVNAKCGLDLYRMQLPASLR